MRVNRAAGACDARWWRSCPGGVSHCTLPPRCSKASAFPSWQCMWQWYTLLGGTCADFSEWFAEVRKRHKGFHHSYPELFPMHKPMRIEILQAAVPQHAPPFVPLHIRAQRLLQGEGVAFQLASQVCNVMQCQGRAKCRSPYVDTVVLFTLMRSHPSL